VRAAYVYVQLHTQDSQSLQMCRYPYILRNCTYMYPCTYICDGSVLHSHTRNLWYMYTHIHHIIQRGTLRYQWFFYHSSCVGNHRHITARQERTEWLRIQKAFMWEKIEPWYELDWREPENWTAPCATPLLNCTEYHRRCNWVELSCWPI